MFIDANIFIITAIGRGRNAERCIDFLKRVDAGEQKSMTSVLVLDEVLNAIEKNTNDRQKAMSSLRKICSIQNLRICEVDFEQFSDSLQFFSAGLQPRDALHVATMRKYGVSTILSYDKDFDSVKDIKRKEP